MKKLFCIMLIFAMAVSTFAETLKVSGHAPSVVSSDPTNPIYISIADGINDDTQLAFEGALKELNDNFTFNSPTNFLQAMGNSSIYASHGGSTRGYSGYKLISATFGTTIGVQLPESLLKIKDNIDGISGSLEKDGDLKLGFSPNLINANIGISMGILKFLPDHFGLLKRDNLYIGLRVGYFKLPSSLFKDISYSSLTIGATVNYQIIPTLSLAGLIKWRGINLGSGLIYNGASASYTVPLKVDPADVGTMGIKINMAPKVFLNMDVTTFTVPLEAVTAIKLFIFNIPFGLGADIAFGKTTLSAGISSDIGYEYLPDEVEPASKGDLSVSGGVSGLPSIFNFKIMTGIGLTVGPVVFDVPITIYPTVNGYTIGITAGAVF